MVPVLVIGVSVLEIFVNQVAIRNPVQMIKKQFACTEFDTSGELLADQVLKTKPKWQDGLEGAKMLLLRVDAKNFGKSEAGKEIG